MPMVSLNHVCEVLPWELLTYSVHATRREAAALLGCARCALIGVSCGPCVHPTPGVYNIKKTTTTNCVSSVPDTPGHRRGGVSFNRA